MSLDLFFDIDDNQNPEVPIGVLPDSELKKEILDEFEKLSNMSVPEYTLFNKWLEIKNLKWSIKEKERIYEIKKLIWAPNDLDDFEKIQPKVVWANNKKDNLDWLILRTFTSTMPWRQNVGRCLRFYVIDEITGKYLGVYSIASDFISLKGRDIYIGWSSDNRTKDRMLGYTAMGSTIVPTQPLGFNYVGGKLISLIVCSDFTEQVWNEMYPHNKLVGITTTSLYGGGSQYDRLVNWKKLKSTEGKIALEPTDRVITLVRKWIKHHYPDKYEEFYKNKTKIISRPKTKLLTFVYQKLGIKTITNNAPRGVYWCSLFENTELFLRKEVEWNGLGERKFDNRLEVLVNIWKNKYAKKRIANIIKNNRFNPEHLFYDDIMGMSWEETREKYLPDIGR